MRTQTPPQPPMFGELDRHLFNAGVHYEIYNVMGGRLTRSPAGAKFTIWAPNATQVFVIGDFNGWDPRSHPMRSLGSSGVWELFVEGLGEGDLYKFAIQTKSGELLIKADPYALYSEVRPRTASRLFDVNAFAWSDEKWIGERSSQKMVIYEVHAGSWRKGLSYLELARELAAYCKEMHFTHVEFLPLSEHPLDESWGYQVTGFYAVTSRFGSPRDFQYLVNYLHKEGIGVIVDWVPAHFPLDDFSLSRFDGTPLYEHADPKQGFHPHWQTAIFNYGRKEVANFLIGSALFWLDKMHVDGLRVDAVASMLYLDYGREAGEWIPNCFGGHENLEAIEFLKHLNAIVHEKHPGALIFAEESTSFAGITRPLEWGGIGFDFKWSLGWMNDTLRYFARDPLFRRHHQSDLTFFLIYAYSERFVLSLSHDEVVHGKKSLLAKMPGDDWQKFANLRLLYSYQICQPGKKLLFMGGEVGQWREWDCTGEIDWWLLQHERHQALRRCFKELNLLYKREGALSDFDFDPKGFRWVDFSDIENGVLLYLRVGKRDKILCIHHATPGVVPHYFVPYPIEGAREIFNSDSEEFGGSGIVNPNFVSVEAGFLLKLPPLATVLIKLA